jgi:hypothetical protein
MELMIVLIDLIDLMDLKELKYSALSLLFQYYLVTNVDYSSTTYNSILRIERAVLGKDTVNRLCTLYEGSFHVSPF